MTVVGLIFNKGASFVEEIELQGLMSTGYVVALIALLARFGLATLDDLIAMAVGPKHGNVYHHLLLQKKALVWHAGL
jgi:hypothetical protein